MALIRFFISVISVILSISIPLGFILCLDRSLFPSKKSLSRKDRKNISDDSEEINAEIFELTYGDFYKRETLLTNYEKAFYKILANKANEQGVIINCKTRLEDIIGSHARGRKLMSDRGKIRARHIDFTILDKNMRILFCIELDDNSHNTPEAYEADMFKDELFEAVGLELYRVKTGTDFYERVETIFESYFGR